MRAPLVLSRHLWVWPLLGAVILSLVGLWVRNRIEGTTKFELASHLQTLLNADVAALRLWFMEQQLEAKSLASDVRIQQAIIDLTILGQAPGVTQAELVKSASARTLQLHLNPLLEARNYLDYVVVGADK